MRRPGAVAVLLLLSAMAARAEEPKRTRAVWLQPLPAAFYSVGLDERGVLLPVGVNWPLAKDMDLVTEATFSSGLPARCGPSAFAFWGSLGTMFHGEDSAGPLEGGFLQPKLLLRHAWRAVGRCAGDEREDFPSESEVAAGVDFGVQSTRGPLYVAVVMGVHLGYCWNCPAGSLISFGPLSNDYPRGNRVKIGFNMNFLRVGMAF